MLSPVSILLLGFLLGMRHATDADHVVAVSTIVSRDRSLRGAARIGSLWGLGHTVTVLLMGGAIVLFGLVIPPRVGLALELAVGVMLVVLGARTLARPKHQHRHGAATVTRPLIVGIVHGLAGSAAAALLVLGTIHDPAWAMGYLAVFGAGTVAGMVLITATMALPLTAAAHWLRDGPRWLALAAGLASIVFGLVIVYRVGILDGLFTRHPSWTPG